jgi:hypothetical protein
MLVCIKEHDVPGFGTVPVGSRWEADSEYVQVAAAFVDEDAEPEKPSKKKVAARKGDG